MNEKNSPANDTDAIPDFFPPIDTRKILERIQKAVDNGVTSEDLRLAAVSAEELQLEIIEHAREALSKLSIHDWRASTLKLLRNELAHRSIPSLELYPGILLRIPILSKIDGIRDDVLNKKLFGFPPGKLGEIIADIDFDLSRARLQQKPQASDSHEQVAHPLLRIEAQKIKKLIHQIFKENTRLFDLKPREFEELIAELLGEKGFSVKLTKQTRDGGYDLIALSVDKGLPLKYLVECKRFGIKHKVGIDIIRSFSDVVRQENANKGIICTTSYFTKGAHSRQSAHFYMLDLKDHDHIIDWVKAYVIGS